MPAELNKRADIVMTLDTRKKTLTLHVDKRTTNPIDVLNAFANVADLFFDNLVDAGLSKQSIASALMTQLSELAMRK